MFSSDDHPTQQRRSRTNTMIRKVHLIVYGAGVVPGLVIGMFVLLAKT